MATDPSLAHNGVPQLTLGWRLQMALHYGNLSVQEMATYLGYSRSQLSRWMNDRGEPPREGIQRMWALRCGVDVDWLMSGAPQPRRPRGGGGPAPVASDGWPSLDDPTPTKLFQWGHAA